MARSLGRPSVCSAPLHQAGPQSIFALTGSLRRRSLVSSLATPGAGLTNRKIAYQLNLSRTVEGHEPGGPVPPNRGGRAASEVDGRLSPGRTYRRSRPAAQAERASASMSGGGACARQALASLDKIVQEPATYVMSLARPTWCERRTKASGMAPTLTQVAKRAGVSLSTASRAYSDPDRLGPETLRKAATLLAAFEQLWIQRATRIAEILAEEGAGT